MAGHEFVIPDLLDAVRFDRFALSRTDERLTGPDGPIHIGHKAFRVLQALVDNKGLLLTKDTLFETVWDGTHVGESALTSVIKELRRALSDDSRSPRVIENVYGRGYRLIVPVVAGDSQDLANSPYVANGGAQTGIANAAAARGGPAVTGSRSSLFGQRATVAILPFANRTGEAENDNLVAALAEDLTAAFSGVWNYHVLSHRIGSQFRNPDTDIRSLASEYGLDYVVEGNVRLLRKSTCIVAQLVDARTGAILLTHQFERPGIEFMALVDDVVEHLCGHIGVMIEKVEIDRAVKMERADTAWQSIKRCSGLMSRATIAQIERAIAEARRAVELAPDYPVAHSLLGVTLGLLYQRNGSRQPELLEEAIANVSCALEMNAQHHVVLTHASFVKYYAQQWEESFQLAESAYEFNPNSVAALNCMAGALTREERYDEALALLDRIETMAPRGSATIFCLMNRVWTYYGMGRIDDAFESASQMLRLVPSNHASLMIRPVLFAERGELAMAGKAMIELRRCFPDEPRELFIDTIANSRLADHVRDRNLSLFARLWDEMDYGALTQTALHG